MTVDGVVRRDAWGVPQLWARDVMALSRLQGRVVGLDRAWQVECQRWRSEGRLAEHVGASGVEWDVFARRVRLDDTARRCFEALDPETAEWVAAHAEGVSAGLAEAAAVTPELAAAGVEPAPWHPWTPVGVLLAQHVLFNAVPAKLWRDRVRRHAPHAYDLLCGGATGADGGPGSGSNAWAVTGLHTASGSPIVAGDPHRVIEVPGVYVQVRLACPEFDVVGLAFPGVPGVPHFGHAGRVAWAITNAMADCHDLYEEELRRGPDGVESREEDGWSAVHAHTERVLVRDGEAVEVEVVETPRGPVVVGGPDDERPLSVRAVTRVDADCGLSAALPLLRARSAADVRAAWRHWVEPVNAVITADAEGTVLEFTAGRVPLRSPQHREGAVPVASRDEGWTGRADHLEAPVPHLTVHANQETAHTRPHSDEFAAPDRAHRIADLLRGRTGLDVDDQRAVHMDTLHAPALRLLPRLRGLEGLGDEAAALRERLLAWDGRMDADSHDAGRYAAWRAAIVRRLCAGTWLAGLRDVDDLPRLFDPWLSVPLRVTLRLERILDDPPAGVDVPSLLASALEEVATQQPVPWGARHVLAPARIAAPGEAPLPRVAVSGDRDCVLATSSVPDADDVAVQASAARYVWDLADRSRSRWVVPHGTSGSPGTPHHDDQQPLWVRGDLVPVPDDDLGPHDEPRSGPA
jgi:penicillin G amidase